MKSTAIAKDMLIGKLITEHPEIIDPLMDAGMHCLGCPASQMESLYDACLIHGLDSDELLAIINDKLKESA
jgi:hybrid cluster-associated redox disulfide protein